MKDEIQTCSQEGRPGYSIGEEAERKEGNRVEVRVTYVMRNEEGQRRFKER